MIVTVSALLLRDRKIYQFTCGAVSPSINDWVLVETDYGREAAICKSLPASPRPMKKNLPKLVRKLSEEDFRKLKYLKKEEIRARDVIAKLIEEEKTPMKLAKTCYTFDKRRVFVYYTAPARVDFRNLIKRINSALKTHVQMIQVSPVECARIIGGLGICGRPFCCSLLGIFSKQKGSPVGKEVGPCGKVLCCYSYEEDK
ncbi:MAG: hypothetical protein J7L54_07000 [Elusimicrobia bacterium]|nr:hypothetical protein [Elusimicrobiota bacterium]